MKTRYDLKLCAVLDFDLVCRHSMADSAAGPSQPRKEKYKFANPNKMTDDELLQLLEGSDSDFDYNLPSDDDFIPNHSESEENSDNDGEGILIVFSFYDL